MARKPKRQRQSRMHAAIDAMGIMGFDAKTVQAKCNQLLKEYGGKEYWPFIEADAYTVLLESLFEETKGETEGNETPVGENLQEANEEGVDTAILHNEGGRSDVGPSKLLLSPASSDITECPHTIRTGDNPNAETNQGKKLQSFITSPAPEVSKIPQPKSNNLNGWLIE